MTRPQSLLQQQKKKVQQGIQPLHKPTRRNDLMLFPLLNQVEYRLQIQLSRFRINLPPPPEVPLPFLHLPLQRRQIKISP